MAKVSSKWSDYVFNDGIDNSEDEIDPNENNDAEEDCEDFVFGSECIPDPLYENLKLWVPRCPTSKKPVVGKRFDSLEAGYAFYKYYATLVGFSTKASTTHKFERSEVISSKYYRCNRDGSKNIGQSTGQRNTSSNRVGCNARMVLKYGGNDTYVVSVFIEEHTHEMVLKYAKHFLKSNRKMEIGHKKFMMCCARANLGPVSSHKLLKQIIGRYINMRTAASDFKNYKRDLMENITNADAQMIINKFQGKKVMNSAFYFEYTVNESQQLTKLFWCDPIARRNYAAFGQVVSFDSTYGTNRYNMVFAPFTGLDNHRRCVTFGCGLLMKEDVDSLCWLFEHFKKAMQNEPTIILTDQDPAMKIAVERVFITTRHRFCMWHIMYKVSTKVKAEKLNMPGYRKTLGHVVWSDQINTHQFEEGWADFLDKFDERGNKWYKDMYDLRSYWIPAYFRDIVLGGLVRTTSISESQNSFFGKYTNQYFTLVELFTHFETALETQRYHQTKNDVDSDTRSLEMKTPLPIERNVAEIYTLRIFVEVQSEISDACFFCCIISQEKGDGFIDYMIKEGMDDYEHSFAAWKSYGCNKIPESMILNRWRKGASQELHSDVMSDVYDQSVRIENANSKLSEVWSNIHACVGLADGDDGRLNVLLTSLKKIRIEFEQNDVATGRSRSIREDIESFACIPIPEEINVKPPAIAKNKGSGTAKRLRGGKEIAMEAQQKPSKTGKRKCKKCGLYAGHDSRNCDKVNEE